MQKENTKPTQEEKAMYFAQYMFQRVLMWHEKSILYAVDGSDLAIVSTKKTDYFLELTPLSDITDEDAIEVAKIAGYNPVRSNASYFSGAVCNSIIDFLRSRSYAIRWRNYSVDQLISFGWLKLKQKGGDQDA